MQLITSTVLLLSSANAVLALAYPEPAASPSPTCQDINQKKCHAQAARFCSSILTATASPTSTTTVFADNPCITGGTPPNVAERAAVTGLVERGKKGARVPPCFKTFSNEAQYSSACSCLSYSATTTVTPVATATTNYFVLRDDADLYAEYGEAYSVVFDTDPSQLYNTIGFQFMSGDCRIHDVDTYNFAVAGAQNEDIVFMVDQTSDTDAILYCNIDRPTGQLNCYNTDGTGSSVDSRKVWMFGDAAGGEPITVTAVPIIYGPGD